MSQRRKRCSAAECREMIKGRHYFCDRHFRDIPCGVRSDLMDAYRKGDSRRVLENLEKARSFLAGKLEKEKMVTGKSDIVDVTLEYRRESPSGSAIGFFQGDVEEDGRGGHNEVWVWLPKSQIEVEGELKHGATVVVSLPEWLAKDKELI